MSLTGTFPFAVRAPVSLYRPPSDGCFHPLKARMGANWPARPPRQENQTSQPLGPACDRQRTSSLNAPGVLLASRRPSPVGEMAPVLSSAISTGSRITSLARSSRADGRAAPGFPRGTLAFRMELFGLKNVQAKSYRPRPSLCTRPRLLTVLPDRNRLLYPSRY